MIGGPEPAALPGFPRGGGNRPGLGTAAMHCGHEGLFGGPAASLVSIDEDLSQSFGSAGLISPSQQQQNAFPMGAATGGMSDDGFEEDEDEYGGMKDRDSEDDPLAMTMRLPRGKTFLSVAQEAAIEEREEREEGEEGEEWAEGEGTQEQMGEEGDEGEEMEEREENNGNGSSRYVRRGSMTFGDEEATDDVDDDGDGATAIDVAALCIDILEKRKPHTLHPTPYTLKQAPSTPNPFPLDRRGFHHQHPARDPKPTTLTPNTPICRSPLYGQEAGGQVLGGWGRQASRMEKFAAGA